MANPRKFSEKIALHNQKQAEETAAFEKIMREVSDATNKVNPSTRTSRIKAPPEPIEKEDATLRPSPQGLGSFRSGSLPNVAAPQVSQVEPEKIKPEEETLATQFGLPGGRSGGASPSRSPGQRGRASSSVGPMRRPADRKHDTSPYGSTAYLSPPEQCNWRRTNSDSALHQSCATGEQQQAQPLSPHHPLHPHQQHPHPHQNHRRPDIHPDMLASMGMNPANRPRSSCEIPRIPNNNNDFYSVYESGGDGGGGGGGGLLCGELQVPGGSLPDLTSVHLQYSPRTSPDYRYSPGSGDAGSPGAGSASPATGGLSPASGSPQGATVPLGSVHHHDQSPVYDTQNMSPLEHSWMAPSYQSHCSPPSQYSSTSNINIPSPTMVHSPGSPVESPQNDYSNLHQALLQPFEQITMQGVDWAQLVQSLVESGWTAHVQPETNMDNPVTNYNTTYINHSSPHSPQTTNSPLTYTQSSHSAPHGERAGRARDPVPGGGFPPMPLASPPAPHTPGSIPDIILTDYSGELDAGIFGGEEAQLRAGLDLDDLTLLEEPSALLPDSAVEHEFRLDRL